MSSSSPCSSTPSFYTERVKPREQARLWSDPVVPGLELLRAHYITHAFVPHAHEEYAFGVIEQGAEKVRFPKGPVLVPENNVTFINPGEVHTGQVFTEEGCTYRMFYLSRESLQHLMGGSVSDAQWGFKDHLARDPQLQTHLIRLHRLLEGPDHTALEKTSALTVTLHHLLQRHAEVPLMEHTPGHTPEVQRVRQVLGDGFQAHLTLDELARQVGLHPVYLIRAFKKAYGMPPHAFQNLLKVQQARRLLQLGVPPGEVALHVGLYDQSHLNRLFRKVYGVPPGQYQVDFIQDRRKP